MKRLLCLLLCALCLCACGKTETPTPTEPTQPAEKLVHKTTTWEDIDAIPIATADMTEEQLRQICMDFFRLQLSVQWVTEEDFDYEITGYHKPASFPTGQVYAGIPYMNPSHTGNLYVFMDHYDSETGLLSKGELDNQTFALRIGNNCASGSFWGWARVVNSVTDYSCFAATEANGFLPVGPYTYADDIHNWTPSHTTPMVCKENGDQTMFESYALLKPADGLVTHYGESGNAHIRMVSQEVVVVRTDHGTIDGQKSYVTYLDQGSSPTATTMDGHPVVVEGGLDRTQTFQAMFNLGYLPFTFAELEGTDPVEPAEASINLSDPQAVTADMLCRASVQSNYAISSLILRVTDQAGQEVYRKIYYPQEHNVRKAALSGLVHIKGMEPYVGNDYTVALDCRLGTGQLITLWHGTLSK